MNKSLMIFLLVIIALIQDHVGVSLQEQLGAKIDEVRLLEQKLKLAESENDQLQSSINDSNCAPY